MWNVENSRLKQSIYLLYCNKQIYFNLMWLRIMKFTSYIKPYIKPKLMYFAL